MGVLCAGCRRSSSTPPRARETHTRQKTHSRPADFPVQSLLQEAGQAELDLGGTFVDLGTADQHKYTRGGWLTGWGGRRVEGRTSVAEAHDGARLSFYAWRGGTRSLQLRARSRAVPRRCQVLLGGRAVGEAFVLGQDWTTTRLTLAEKLAAGELELELRLDPPGGAPAEVDWIWLGRGGAKPAGRTTKVDVIRLDRPQQALVGDAPRTLSYFLLVPTGGALVFDYGAQKPTEFVVQARLDESGGPRRLFHARSRAPRWTAARVDLSALAGRAIRLDLVTADSAAVAGWANPEIVQRQPQRPPLRRRADGRPPRHVVQILADAARQDAYRPFNPRSRIAAPALERLAASGVVFPGARANANFTLPSLVALFSGHYAWTLIKDGSKASGSRAVGLDLFTLPERLPRLSSHLRRNGFTTAAFVANVFISKPFGLASGWDHLELLHLAGTSGIQLCRRDEWAERKFPEVASKVYDKAIAWIRAQKDTHRRLYLYIHTMDTHSPYRYHADQTEQFLAGRKYSGRLGRVLRDDTKSIERLGPEDRRYVRALYDGEVAYHDLHLGRLVAALEEAGLLSETMIVYSNDHGEELFDRGGLFHSHSLAEELLRSPLVIHAPGLLSPGRAADLVELVDVAPTIVDALGLKPLPAIHGRSLLRTTLGHAVAFGNAAPSTNGAPIHPAFALSVGALKLVQWVDHQELYDLATDAAEQRDRSKDHPVALRLCESLLGRAIASPAKDQRLAGLHGAHAGGAAGKAVLSPRLRRQLEALGYIK